MFILLRNSWPVRIIGCLTVIVNYNTSDRVKRFVRPPLGSVARMVVRYAVVSVFARFTRSKGEDSSGGWTFPKEQTFAG